MNEPLRRSIQAGALALVVASMTPAFADTDAISLSTESTGGYVHETVAPVIMSVHGSDADPLAPSVIVPGDELSGTLHVRNDGPSAAVLEAFIVDTTNGGPDNVALDDFFTGDVNVSAGSEKNSLVAWNNNSTPIEGTDYEGVKITETPLPQGEEVPITIALSFPADAISGNSAGDNATGPDGAPNDYAAGARSSRLDVFVRLKDSTPEARTVVASTGGVASTESSFLHSLPLIGAVSAFAIGGCALVARALIRKKQ